MVIRKKNIGPVEKKQQKNSKKPATNLIQFQFDTPVIIKDLFAFTTSKSNDQ